MPNKVVINKGDRYGRLTIVKEVEPRVSLKTGKKYRKVLCECDCGIDSKVLLAHLKNGHTRSCGCLAVDMAKTRRTHGMSVGRKQTAFYRVWVGMKSRCKYVKRPSWEYYGARGIKVCKRWEKFENFMADMLPTYKEGLQIDRINNDSDYKPSNCRWVTSKENCRNKTNNVRYKGRCVVEWAEYLGVNYENFRQLSYRQGVEHAIEYYRSNK